VIQDNTAVEKRLLSKCSFFHLDDTLAPAGQHVANLFCQQLNRILMWDQQAEIAADLIYWTMFEKYAPGLQNNQCWGSPSIQAPDLERISGFTKGDIMHGNNEFLDFQDV